MLNMQKIKSKCELCDCRFKKNTFFSILSEHELDVFSRYAVTYLCDRRESVFMEQSRTAGIYIIRTGCVKLVKRSRAGREQIIRLLYPGDLIGFEVFYNSDVYENTAVAIKASELCFLKKEDFFQIINSRPAMAGKIINAMGRELNFAYVRISNMGLMNARAKMANLICNFAAEYGVEEEGKIRLQLTLSRLEIAELLGITQETTIRLLKSFKEDGFLDINKKELKINSIESLRQIAELK